MDLLIIILLVICSWALGLFFYERMNVKFDSLAEEFAFSATLGLGILGFLVLSLGLISILYKWVLVSVLLVLALFLSAYFVKIFVSLSKLRMKIKGVSLLSMILAFLFVLCLLLTLLGTLSPPIGNDAMAYHLAIPKAFIENHKISYIEHTRESLWPNLIEMFFTLGMVLNSDILAKLFCLAITLLLVCAIFSFCKRYFSSEVGIVAGVLFFITPVVFQQTAFAYNDLALALFAFLAFYSLLIYISSSHTKWIIISGIFSGFCMSTKYIGIKMPIIVVLVLLIEALYTKDRARYLKALCIYSFLTLVVSGVWYLRSYLILGNPVFPFAADIFGAGYQAHIKGREGAGMGIGIVKFIMFPWNITMYPKQFGGEILSSVFISFIPGFFLRHNIKGRVVRIIITITLAYVILWFFTVQIVRFILPCLGFLAIMVALVVVGMERRRIKILLSSILVLLLGFNTVLCVYYNRDVLKLKLGMDTKDEYLERNERSYKVYKFINNNLPEDSTILSVGEPRSYYCDRKFIYESIFRSDTHYHERVKHPGDLVKLLKTKGITHVLVWKLLYSEKTPFTGGFIVESLLDNEDYRNKHLMQIFNYNYIHPSHPRSTYVLYELI